MSSKTNLAYSLLSACDGQSSFAIYTVQPFKGRVMVVSLCIRHCAELRSSFCREFSLAEWAAICQDCETQVGPHERVTPADAYHHLVLPAVARTKAMNIPLSEESRDCIEKLMKLVGTTPARTIVAEPAVCWSDAEFRAFTQAVFFHSWHFTEPDFKLAGAPGMPHTIKDAMRAINGPVLRTRVNAITDFMRIRSALTGNEKHASLFAYALQYHGSEATFSSSPIVRAMVEQSLAMGSLSALHKMAKMFRDSDSSDPPFENPSDCQRCRTPEYVIFCAAFPLRTFLVLGLF
eukprot:TRINITY_DN4871_c0_g1_i1.p1 TRINITY_DN4871_c0_g1~~TRINITY_DN4871_c0_g1_i1.p1  ORF type:complete len:291 (+),score=33.62 TRINITY_DN4871_c0_g1_i1:61-933(+)